MNISASPHKLWRQKPNPCFEPAGGRTITNRIALLLGLSILAFLGLDYLLNGGQLSLFLARKFMALVDYVEFWR